MSLFTFRQPEMLTENYQHREDVTIPQELQEVHPCHFYFDFPPGPYFGPVVHPACQQLIQP